VSEITYERHAGASENPLMPESRRFPPPWTIEEHTECFIVRDANSQALGYFYYDDEPSRRAVTKRRTKYEAKRPRKPRAMRRCTILHR
jgi:hypothetical protein